MTRLPVLTLPAWLDDAACRDTDPAYFFPNQGESLAPGRAVCRRCETKAECLAYALDAEGDTAAGSRWGIYAGLSPEQRARMRRAG